MVPKVSWADTRDGGAYVWGAYRSGEVRLGRSWKAEKVVFLESESGRVAHLQDSRGT